MRKVFEYTKELNAGKLDAKWEDLTKSSKLSNQASTYFKRHAEKKCLEHGTQCIYKVSTRTDIIIFKKKKPV